MERSRQSRHSLLAWSDFGSIFTLVDACCGQDQFIFSMHTHDKSIWLSPRGGFIVLMIILFLKKQEMGWKLLILKKSLFGLWEFCRAAAATAKSLQSCLTLRPHRRQPTRLPRPWDSPGKNTGVGCHFLLQCMKLKSEREVTQSCPNPSDPMDCSLPGSSIHGIFQARVLEWGAIAFCVIMYSEVIIPTLLKCSQC